MGKKTVDFSSLVSIFFPHYISLDWVLCEDPIHLFIHSFTYSILMSDSYGQVPGDRVVDGTSEVSEVESLGAEMAP